MTKNIHAPDPHELAEQEHAIRAKAEAELAALKAQREAECHRRHPLLNLIGRRSLVLERMARARRGRQLQEVRAAEFLARADECIANDNEGTLAGFYNVISQNLPAFHADRTIVEIDRWLAAREPELRDLESQILKLAAELRLEQLLPADLVHRATPAHD